MQAVPPYSLVKRLGEGGMAEVFKAIKCGPDGFEKPIALKRILPFLSDNRAFIRMLTQEARTQAQLAHPNLVQVFDFVRWQNTYAIEMEYVSGKNVREILDQTHRKQVHIPWPCAVYIVTEILSGLDYAHKFHGSLGPLGIVHRDVNPRNILVSYDGWVKLSDFGIVRTDLDQDRTPTNVIKGKERYLSPEQVEHQPVDHRSDLFSVGTLLYELICGMHPFDSGQLFQTMKSIASSSYKNSRLQAAKIPDPIHVAIDTALAKNRTDRFEDGGAFRRALLKHQDPSWQSTGRDQLARWMQELYASPNDREEKNIEPTSILETTPLLLEITRSKKISRPNLSGVRGPWFLALFLLTVVGIATTLTTDWTEKTSRPLDQNSQVHSSNLLPSYTSIFRATTSALPFGHLDIQGPDNAQIFINGRFIGRLPMKNHELLSGEYLVAIAPEDEPRILTRVQILPEQVTAVYWNQPPSPPEVQKD